MSEFIKYVKDPDATLDYTVNWSVFLGVDTIVASEWDIPDDLNKEDESFSTSSATVWLSNGLLGNVYRVTNRITTAAGRINDQTIYLQIEEQ